MLSFEDEEELFVEGPCEGWRERASQQARSESFRKRLQSFLLSTSIVNMNLLIPSLNIVAINTPAKLRTQA